MDCSKICKRFDGLASTRTTVQQSWEFIEKYVTPYRGRFFYDQKSEHSIEWSNRLVYDSTAVSAHQNLAANIHGALTSPSIRWFDLRFRDEKLNKNSEAATWLQNAGERVHYELIDSNFALEVNELYQDLVGFGTGAITLEEPQGQGWQGLNFKSVPIKEAFFEEDFNGRVLRFYRMIEWTPQQILSKFGDDVPQIVKDMEDHGNTTKLNVLFAIYPRNNKIVPVGEKIAASRRPWEFCYILKDSCELIGKPGAYYEMPAFIPRWRKTSSSVWGNSPAHFAMGDILSLNEARKMQLTMAEKLIEPPIFAEERAIIADLDLSARALSIVGDIDKIEAFRSEGSLPVSDHMITQLQDAVKDYFFTDQLQFPRPQATPMSATEASIRMEQLAKLLGPTLGRLQNDMLDPIVSRSFKMLARDGQIEPPPQSVVDANAEFDVEYLGSLSRAQRSDQAASVERLVSTVASLAEVFPKALDVIDADEMVRYLGRDLNVPAAILKGEDKVKQERKAAQEQQQAAMAAEQQRAEGEAMQAQGAGMEALSQ